MAREEYGGAGLKKFLVSRFLLHKENKASVSNHSYVNDMKRILIKCLQGEEFLRKYTDCVPSNFWQISLCEPEESVPKSHLFSFLICMFSLFFFRLLSFLFSRLRIYLHCV